VNNEENYDLVFILDNPSRSQIFAHKALVLYRSMEKELVVDPREEFHIKKVLEDKRMKVPAFFKSVVNATQGESIFLKDISCKQTVLRAMEYLYCDKFI
jgi:hypothetical protein